MYTQESKNEIMLTELKNTKAYICVELSDEA